jgi:IclR family pca regulon transcriptional regulator
VLYVERMRAGITRLGVDIRVGTVIPAATTMIGWSILAFLPATEVDRVLTAQDRPPNAPGLALLPDLHSRLAGTRDQGYALSESHISSGLTVLAVPVRDQDGYPVAGLSVAAPSIRMTPDELRVRALKPLQIAANLIARGIQATGGAVVN